MAQSLIPLSCSWIKPINFWFWQHNWGGQKQLSYASVSKKEILKLWTNLSRIYWGCPQITLTLNKSAIFWSICVWELFEYEEGKFVFEHSEDSWLGCMKAVFSHLKFDEVCCLSWDAVSPSTSIVKFYTLITSLPVPIKFLLTSDFWFVNMLCITANKGCKSSGPGHQEISWWFGGYYSIFC